MTNTRTGSKVLNREDVVTLREMADKNGLAAMLRAVAQMICNDHPDLHAGIETRIALNKIAIRLENTPGMLETS